MTRFPSRASTQRAQRSVRSRDHLKSKLVIVPFLLGLAGCGGASSGAPALAVAEPNIAAVYLPLHGTTHLGLDSEDGAAVVIAPGIAATNAHNRNLVDPKTVIGARQDFDLLFFRVGRDAAPQTAETAVGQRVVAYGQGGNAELRVAHGVVREIHACDGCGPAPAYLVFAGNAGPGFSGGPVLDVSGKLVGITFGYKNEGKMRLIYAYPMSRVRTELSALQNRRN